MPASAMSTQATAINARAVADVLQVDLKAIAATAGGNTNTFNTLLAAQVATAANTFATALAVAGSLDNQATAVKARALAALFGINPNDIGYISAFSAETRNFNTIFAGLVATPLTALATTLS
jgi:hypothetical protein